MNPDCKEGHRPGIYSIDEAKEAFGHEIKTSSVICMDCGEVFAEKNRYVGGHYEP